MGDNLLSNLYFTIHITLNTDQTNFGLFFTAYEGCVDACLASFIGGVYLVLKSRIFLCVDGLKKANQSLVLVHWRSGISVFSSVNTVAHEAVESCGNRACSWEKKGKQRKE